MRNGKGWKKDGGRKSYMVTQDSILDHGVNE